MIEALLSGGVEGGGLVPAGTIIGFSGTLAQAGALNDWAICDGTHNTPNLKGRMIIGASGSYPFGSEGQGGRIGGTSGSRAGSHTGSPTFQNSMVSSIYGGGTSSSSGGHSHSLETGTIPNPAARQTLFIQAIRETHIPQYGVVWMESAPRQGVAVADVVFERFLVGVTNSSRGNTGSDTISLVLSTSSSGSHDHYNYSSTNTRDSPDYGGNQITSRSGGSHTHTVARKSVVAVPPWYGLVPGEAKNNLAPWEGVALAYNGELASLPPPWREFTPLRGRIPRGASTPGSTGGTSQQTVTATLGSDSFTHDHSNGRVGEKRTYTANWAHASYSYSHTHSSMSLTYSNLPPYRALYYITI